ncbi:sodium/proline symporter [Endozoicomonas arenosclerae]|uniref:sodium/proline symporter n=1 Tax=Endozoicomonas arenosclerae TaxID=1633495 RepID=UPI0007822E35|nr:sodium/proline symporter [Endozoicomonas arenosclerae]
MSQYIVIVLYFLGLGILGYIAARRLNGLDDFFTGGKRLGFWVTALSTQATGESAWLLLGLTGLGAMVGLSAFWVVVGELAGVGVAWFLMASPFHKASERCQALTTTDYLLHRFPKYAEAIRCVSVITLVLFCTVYAAAEIDATGAVLEHALGWNYHAGVLTGFLVVTLYCAFGGFLAVAWTDCVQGMMMMLALLLLPLMAWWSMNLPDGLFTSLANIDSALLTALGPGDPVIKGLEIVGLVAIGLGFVGTPHIFTRFLAVKSHDEIRHGRWVAIVYTLLADSAAVLAGMLGRVLFTSAEQSPHLILGNGGQNILPMMTEAFFPMFIVGFYIAAILAAIMSTFSSLLLQATSSVTCDWLYFHQRHQLTGSEARRHSRNITWGLAMVALVLAVSVTRFLPEHTIFWFAVFGMSGITATFSPMIILAMFWKGFSSAGALAAMISGAVMILVGKLWLQQLDDVGIYFQALETLPLAFAASLLSGWLASLVWPDEASVLVTEP